MPLPDNAHYIPGTNRRMVRLSDGTQVTRSTAMNIYAQSIGARNDYQLRILRAKAIMRGTYNDPRYKADAQRAAQQGRVDPVDFRNIAAVLSNEPRDSHGRLADRGPDSAIAHYLYATGRISSPADYAAGETPDMR